MENGVGDIHQAGRPTGRQAYIDSCHGLVSYRVIHSRLQDSLCMHIKHRICDVLMFGAVACYHTCTNCHVLTTDSAR